MSDQIECECGHWAFQHRRGQPCPVLVTRLSPPFRFALNWQPRREPCGCRRFTRQP